MHEAEPKAPKVESKIIDIYAEDNANCEATRWLFGIQKDLDKLEELQKKEKISKKKAFFLSGIKQIRELFDEETIKQGHQIIRTHMAKVYKGGRFIEQVLSNERTSLKAKCIFIKYIEKIRLSAIQP